MSTPFNNQWQLPHLEGRCSSLRYGSSSAASASQERREIAHVWQSARRAGPPRLDEDERTRKQVPRSLLETSSPNPPPIIPAEPLDNTQAEVPKVGNTDAPGG
jgi:hypothetical protein